MCISILVLGLCKPLLKSLILLFVLLFFIVVDFVIHWNESAMDLHVFPIPIPPPTSLSTHKSLILACKTPPMKHFWWPLKTSILIKVSGCTWEMASTMGTVFSWNVADQLTANRTVTVKENCHFGLLFDHSSYMEAAAASIRATGGRGSRSQCRPNNAALRLT